METRGGKSNVLCRGKCRVCGARFARLANPGTPPLYCGAKCRKRVDYERRCDKYKEYQKRYQKQNRALVNKWSRDSYARSATVRLRCLRATNKWRRTHPDADRTNHRIHYRRKRYGKDAKLLEIMEKRYRYLYIPLGDRRCYLGDYDGRKVK